MYHPAGQRVLVNSPLFRDNTPRRRVRIDLNIPQMAFYSLPSSEDSQPRYYPIQSHRERRDRSPSPFLLNGKRPPSDAYRAYDTSRKSPLRSSEVEKIVRSLSRSRQAPPRQNLMMSQQVLYAGNFAEALLKRL